MENQYDNRWYEELARDLKSGSKVPESPDTDIAAVAPAVAPAPIDFTDGAADTPAATDTQKKKSKKKKKSDPLTTVILALSICIFLGSAGFLVYKYVYQPIQLSNSTKDIRESHQDSEANSAENGVWENDGESAEEERLENGVLKAFEKDLAVNPDIVGYITVPNTPIKYSVTQTKDNSYYLNHDVNKDYNAAGCPFVDYRNEIGLDTMSKCTLIYGHHRRNGTMFAKLKLYNEVEFYKENPVITFDTIYNRGQWVVFANFRATTSSDTGTIFKYIKTSFADDTEFLNFVASIKKRSLINTPIEVNADDQILLLSTCSYEKENWRMVIAARKVREGETQIDVSSAEKNPAPLMP